MDVRLVVSVPGCRPGGHVFDYRHYQIFDVAVGVEQGPLSLARINEELLERKLAARVQKTLINDRGGYAALTTQYLSIRQSWY
jgi:hypothetical protein